MNGETNSDTCWNMEFIILMKPSILSTVILHIFRELLVKLDMNITRTGQVGIERAPSRVLLMDHDNAELTCWRYLFKIQLCCKGPYDEMLTTD